ncbi:MAG: hypothetical protein OXB96_01475 [Candidatus Kaiserbacteria bacterium]|nr:hypothetical protein [Candidatus Kaiserbacteria bacterium]
MRIYTSVLMGVLITTVLILSPVVFVKAYGQRGLSSTEFEDLGKLGIRPTAMTLGDIKEVYFEDNFEFVNSEYNIVLFRIPVNTVDCSEIQPEQDLKNNFFYVKYLGSEESKDLADMGIPKVEVYRVFFRNPEDDKLNTTLKSHFYDTVDIDLWGRVDKNSPCDSDNKKSGTKGVTQLGIDLDNFYEEDIEYKKNDCEIEVNEFEDSAAWLDIPNNCFRNAEKSGAHITKVDIELPKEITDKIKIKPRDGTNKRFIKITDAPEVTKRGDAESKYTINFSAHYCVKNINEVTKKGDPAEPDHDKCTTAPETKDGVITVIVKNTYDEPKVTGCAQPDPRCGSATAAVSGSSCFTGTGLNINPSDEEVPSLSIGLGGDATQEYKACNTHPRRGKICAGPATITFRNLRDGQGCTTTPGIEKPVNIKIDVTTGPEGRDIDIIGNKVRSITFTASDTNRNSPLWRHWYLARKKKDGYFQFVACNKENIASWDSGTAGQSVTLDEEGDNNAYVCFGAKEGEEEYYLGRKYSAVIDTQTYNRDVSFAVAGAPSNPWLTVSGTAEPSATVEVVKVTSNEITVPQESNIVTASPATGVWSTIITNAINPDQDTNLAVVTRVSDGLHEVVQTHKTTIPSNPTGGPPPPPPETETGDTTGDDTSGGGGGGSTGEDTNPQDTNPQRDRQPPFTIRADTNSITEGASITWTVTKGEDATTAGATVSCTEQGEWGATPLEKKVSIQTAGNTTSFTMKTADDETVESVGSITCSVTGSRYIVKVFSNDKDSGLIVDCTFGSEKDETGRKEKEQCGIKHLFQLANNIMKLLLWLAITGAGILLFYKGARLAINVFVKGGDQQARKDMQSALKAIAFGLLFVLSAYLIVKAGFDIIGYNLNGGNPFVWNESSLQTPEVPEPARQEPPANPSTAGTQPQQPEPVGTLSPIEEPQPPEEEQQPTAAQETEKCVRRVNGELKKIDCTCTNCTTLTRITTKNKNKVHADLAEKLYELNETAGLKSWRVTEAWPTTSSHSGDCHYVGTCVDINFIKVSPDDLPSDDEIASFIVAAEDAGLFAVWETRDSSRVAALQSRSDIEDKNIQDYEVPDHFSVYDCSLPEPPRLCSAP